MRHVKLGGWLWLFGGVLVVGCSLNGLVFDRDGAGGASSSGDAGGGGGSDIAGDAGVEAGVVLPSCLTGETSPSGAGDGEVDCSDGRDNDKNGKADCADANCVAIGFKCFSPPSGWSGMGVFYESSPDSATCCPRDFPEVGLSGGREPSGKEVTCSSCGCAAADVQCQPSPILADADELCSTGMTPFPQAPDQCQQVGGMASFAAKAPTLTVNGCAITGGVVSDMPASTWAVVDRVCVASDDSKGCGGEEHFCARPEPGDPLCIWREGPSDCPIEFPKKSTFFRGVKDSRGCAACNCGSPEGKASCSVATTLYSTIDCSGGSDQNLGQVPNDNTCVAKVGVQSVQTSVSTVNPTCPPSGGGPIGKVVTNLDSETTICCPE